MYESSLDDPRDFYIHGKQPSPKTRLSSEEWGRADRSCSDERSSLGFLCPCLVTSIANLSTWKNNQMTVGSPETRDRFFGSI